MSQKELVILTGVSGAGKSTAMGFMEDAGFYCVDNMPPQLISTFINLISTKDNFTKVAMVIDVRSNYQFDELFLSLDSIEQYGFETKTIYLDVRTSDALKRYKLTRRKHPLADKFDGDIEEAIKDEKKHLAPLRQQADFLIDTTDFQPNQLKERLSQILFGNNGGAVQIHCTSFGFKYGIVTEADFVLDVRCLPNPYWEDSLKTLTGMDQPVVDYVFKFDESNELLKKLLDMVDFLLPLYVREGKSQLVFAIGCTGGCHRSVAFAEKLGEHLKKRWSNVSIHHRDINK